MQAKIISLKGVIFDSSIKSLNIMTSSGEITVLPQHRPLLTAVKPCVIKVIDEQGDEKFFEADNGFLEVKRNKDKTFLTILVG